MNYQHKSYQLASSLLHVTHPITWKVESLFPRSRPLLIRQLVISYAACLCKVAAHCASEDCTLQPHLFHTVARPTRLCIMLPRNQFGKSNLSSPLEKTSVKLFHGSVSAGHFSVWLLETQPRPPWDGVHDAFLVQASPVLHLSSCEYNPIRNSMTPCPISMHASLELIVCVVS